MRNRVSYLAGLPMVCLAAGCGGGGQSFDDGSGDWRGRRDHVDTNGVIGAINQQPSVRIMWDTTADQHGFEDALTFVGDLDADGYSDFAVHSSYAGVAYVFYGRQEFPEELALNDADFTIVTTGRLSLAKLGDFNGDGFDDIGVVSASSSSVGVILGSSERRTSLIDADAIRSAAFPEKFDCDMSGPGDTNADGFADLLLSCAHSSQLFFGSDARTINNLDEVDSVYLSASTRFPWLTKGSAGDLDGDGISDLLMTSNEGTAFYYGRAGAGWGSGPEPIAPDAIFAGSVRTLGDWDGDGYGDLAQVIDRYAYGPLPTDPNSRQILSLNHDLLLSYGGPQRFSGSVELARPPSDGTYSQDVELALGDLNGDGQLDLVLGSPRNPMGPVMPSPADYRAGCVFFVPGVATTRSSMFRFDPDFAALRGKANRDPGDYLGLALAANGDANGDGYQDVLIMRGPTLDNPLEVELIFGGADLW